MSCLALFILTALSAEPDTFDQFFTDFTKKRDGILVLEARFEQQTILPEETLKTQGTLLYAKPRRIVFRTEEPERTTLIDGKRGYEYEPEIKQLVIFDMEDRPQTEVFFLGFDDNTKTLREAFDITLQETTGDPRGSRSLLIKPKAEDLEDAYFVQVTLYLRDQDYLPYRIHIVNDEESQVILDVKQFAVNGAPGPLKTQISLLEGTKIIENEIPIETVGAGGKQVPAPIRFDVPPEDASEEEPAPETAEDVIEVKELAPPAPSPEGRP